MGNFYLAMCVIGTVLPWTFFGAFFISHGFDIPLFVRSLFANGPAAGFSTDVVLSIVVFWVWSFLDARETGTRSWWIMLPAGCLVGLSLALPLYPYLRSNVHRVTQLG